MSTTEAFASSGEDAINRPITVTKDESQAPSYALDRDGFEDFYEIDNTVKFIADGNYKRIALQFPDELLHASVPIYKLLKRRLEGHELYVLADTSYGSCCVDEVAASHVDADAMVHYGHACLSLNSRLPVLHVFGKRPLDVESCCQSLIKFILDEPGDFRSIGKIVLKHDVAYSHVAGLLVEKLRSSLTSSDVIYDPPSHRSDPSTVNLTHGVPKLLESSPDRDAGETLTVWIGEESPSLTKLIMISSGHNIISYSPKTGQVQVQSQHTNRMLMRRYTLVQKARNSDVFGILIGTLGVASYLPLITHIRAMLKRGHKKFYTVSVGKINPAKLANFMEIDCWIWVSCSEGIVESTNYFKPIVTPFELEAALRKEHVWTGEYTFDFKELLDHVPDEGGEGAAIEKNNDSDEDDDSPQFSLISGTYRHAKRFGGEAKTTTGASSESSSRAVATRSQENALARLGDSAAAHFLQERTYQGLDPRLGQDTPSVLEQGRSGIARAYDDVGHES